MEEGLGSWEKIWLLQAGVQTTAGGWLVGRLNVPFNTKIGYIGLLGTRSWVEI